MPHIVVQLGHVPRRTGSTGAHREQEFALALAPRITDRLTALGHQVTMIDAVTGDGAKDRVPDRADVFVSLHVDGHNTRKGGASVGYPPGSDHALAAAWKRHHGLIYPQIPAGHDPARDGWPDPKTRPGLWLADNYTSNLSGYYMWRRTRHIRHRFLAEHGTSPHDIDWLFAHLAECADAHVAAIGETVGHPTIRPPEEDEVVIRLVRQTDGGGKGRVWVQVNYQTLRWVANDPTDYGRLVETYGPPQPISEAVVGQHEIVGRQP